MCVTQLNDVTFNLFLICTNMTGTAMCLWGWRIKREIPPRAHMNIFAPITVIHSPHPDILAHIPLVLPQNTDSNPHLHPSYHPIPFLSKTLSHN